MRKNALNVGFFLMLAGGLFFLWQYAEKNWVPQPPKRETAEEKAARLLDEQKKLDEEAAAQKAAARAALATAGGGLALAGELPKPKKEEPKKPADLSAGGVPARALAEAVVGGARRAAGRPVLVALGDHTFYNRVLLTTQGGGVQQVVLPQFGQADRLGREVKIRDANGNPTKDALQLHLIPGTVHPRAKQLREDYPVPDLAPGPVPEGVELAEPSFALFHYPAPEDKNPDTLLGTTNWALVSDSGIVDGTHTVVFEKELGDPYFLTLRKTYTLNRTDYHIGLKVEIEKQKVSGAKKGTGALRYQLSGPRGLPIEGEWYTSTYRVAITGWRDKTGTPRRQYEDSAAIGNKRGGEMVARGENAFKYMAVATQYFASAVAVDDTAEGAAKNPWAYVRATTELPFDKKQDPNLPHFDDITVRAASETLDLAPGEKVTHSYLLYNGPAKVGLLSLMPSDRKVAPELVERYKDKLILGTITDFRSETWLGRFASFIYWTDLVIATTNLMHWLLAVIHGILGTWQGSWALSIVVLTGCVRMVLLYPSRKQTAMSMKMMEVQKALAPEFEKLQEKYKDDFHSYNREKTRLMMQHGANPFAMMGGCLLLVAQMPIMMGLYFCLQESVFFRLESFLWIDNMAAPDMLKWWTEGIPYISTPEDIGSFIYLGPYFNLLPLLAVGLMLYQQSKMMPPTNDPQAEQQRVMMKFMMIMMAVFFYKVAAGLALYFIVSTAWGIVERMFIPTPKVDPANPGDATAATSATSATSATVGTSAAPATNGKPATAAEAVTQAKAKSKGFLTRLRERLEEKMEEMRRQADEQAKRQIRNEPNRPDEKGGDGPPPDRKRDKKNKRRKK